MKLKNIIVDLCGFLNKTVVANSTWWSVRLSVYSSSSWNFTHLLLLFYDFSSFVNVFSYLLTSFYLILGFLLIRTMFLLFFFCNCVKHEIILYFNFKFSFFFLIPQKLCYHFVEIIFPAKKKIIEKPPDRRTDRGMNG